MNDTQTNTWKLIVGLGNPGEEYAGTRHNVGFMVLERVMKTLNKAGFEEKHMVESRVFLGRFRGRDLRCQMPQTFMNLSGKAVAPLARKEGILPSEILVIHDDLDLPIGRLRLKIGGASGGHNGLKSLMEELGSEEFGRVRVGIGRPEHSTVDYVLSKVKGEEAECFLASLDAAAEAVICILKSGMSRAMNQFNGWSPNLPVDETKKTTAII